MYYNKGISYFFRITKELEMEWDNEKHKIRISNIKKLWKI
jgi:hypothetical protein